jgi:hypothetical protein
MNWSPPEHIQFLSNTLIGATTIRYANILQKSPSLQHVVNRHGADRLWGSCHPKYCTQDNYFYSPPNNDQISALQEAQNLKQTNVVGKTLGVVLLDEETLAEIAQSKLTLIATIPPRCINVHPHPNTRIPKKKGTTHLPIGLVLGITLATKTSNNTEVLIAINTLRKWKKKYCPAATIHEDNFITELTNQPSKNFSLQESDWHKAILEAWKWTTSPTGTQGIILSEDQRNVNCLKGSRKYNNLTKKVALQLFTFFAQEWENKNNMLPMRARQWWYKYSEKAEAVPPATRLRNKRKRREKQKQIFKECMDIMHNKVHKRRKGNQSSQQAIPAQNNPIPEAQSTPPVGICHCGNDILTNNDGTPMIQCDSCQTWLHISCSRLEDDADLPDTFFCLCCDTRAANATRKKKRRKIAISMKIKCRIQQHQEILPTTTWTCPSCTYDLNNPDEQSCSICNIKRPRNKTPAQETRWVSRVLPTNALQKADSAVQPPAHSVPAFDIISRVQNKAKDLTHEPVTSRKKNKRKTPTASARPLLPLPTKPTIAQIVEPPAALPKPITISSAPLSVSHLLTHNINNLHNSKNPNTSCPLTSLQASVSQFSQPQKSKDKRRRQDKRKTPSPSPPLLPASLIPQPRKNSHTTKRNKRQLLTQAPSARYTPTALPRTTTPSQKGAHTPNKRNTQKRQNKQTTPPTPPSPLAASTPRNSRRTTKRKTSKPGTRAPTSIHIPSQPPQISPPPHSPCTSKNPPEATQIQPTPQTPTPRHIPPEPPP